MTIAFRKPTLSPACHEAIYRWRHEALGVRAIGIALLAVTLLATCNVDEGTTSTQTLPPIGTPSNTVPPTTATTVVAGDGPADRATSTIALPAGACVFSPPDPAAEVTFEIGTRLYSINPGSGATQLPHAS